MVTRSGAQGGGAMWRHRLNSRGGRRANVADVLLLLAACVTAEGTWEGDCLFPSATIPLSLTIDEESDGSGSFGLTGEVTWTVLGPSDEEYSGELTGVRDGSDVSVDLAFPMDGHNSIEFSVYGSIGGSTIEGTTASEYEGSPAEGECEWERD